MARGNTPEFMREIGKLGGRPNGSKSWKTRALEDARQHYLDSLKENIEGLTQVHIEEALKPKNREERKDALYQIVGKPVERVEVEQTTTLKVDV